MRIFFDYYCIVLHANLSNVNSWYSIASIVCIYLSSYLNFSSFLRLVQAAHIYCLASNAHVFIMVAQNCINLLMFAPIPTEDGERALCLNINYSKFWILPYLEYQTISTDISEDKYYIFCITMYIVFPFALC